LNMGLCRGLSVTLGLAICSSLHLGMDSPERFLAWENLGMLLSWPFYSIIPMIIYVASVTFIAAKETMTTKMRIRPWLPGITVAVWMYCVVYPYPQRDNVLSYLPIIIAILPVTVTVVCLWRLKGKPTPQTVQKTIGMLVGNLLLIQAAVVYFNSYSTATHSKGIPFVIAFGGAYLVFTLLCRRFYSS
ncbi:MAG: hypothetical protein GY794_25025, partial [bacterium]|nr:hypothetical protein [bacterium]